jgi:hypothetical protein
MRESEIQSKCINYLKKQGWYCLKVIRCNVNGYPDLTIFKDGQTIFIEFKTEIGKQSKLQEYQQQLIEAQGFKYYVVRSLDELKLLLK